MIKISCVIMFLEKMPVDFDEVSSEVQKNFNEFNNFKPKRLMLSSKQTMDDVPNDVPVCIFSSEVREILLAKGRFTFTERILDRLSAEECNTRIEETLRKITDIFNSNSKFVGLKYRLGIVVESDFFTKDAAQKAIKRLLGEESNLEHEEIELAINDKKLTSEFIVNVWKRVYINENRNSFLVDINNHVDTFAVYKENKISEMYASMVKDDLEVILNDLSD